MKLFAALKMYFFDQQAWEDVCDLCGLCCYEREVSVEEKSLNALGLVLKSISASGNSLNLEKNDRISERRRLQQLCVILFERAFIIGESVFMF